MAHLKNCAHFELKWHLYINIILYIFCIYNLKYIYFFLNNIFIDINCARRSTSWHELLALQPLDAFLLEPGLKGPLEPQNVARIPKQDFA